MPAPGGASIRLGPEAAARRLEREKASTARLLHQGEGLLRLERYLPLDRTILFFLRLVGLHGTARRQFLDIRVVSQEWTLPTLPAAFDGFRILQLSDLHLDIDLALAPAIAARMAGVAHDAAVVTGDFRNKTEGDAGPCLQALATLTPWLAPERWGILGNHDFLEMSEGIEAAGLPLLLNEAAVVRRGGEELWIAGVDDPHFYRTHDLARARQRIPSSACSILLAHSPEIYAEAAEAGFAFQMSGHTHGGQLCLPGGWPLVVPCRAPAKFVRGRWTHGSLQGYTSPGTGSCGVAARLFCPPEITLHTLRRPS